jgi:Ca2+-binding RTX toxin-like protein
VPGLVTGGVISVPAGTSPSDAPDTLFGRRGDDILVGAGGDDELFGGRGNDFLDGGFGFDLIDGGAGTDTTSYLFFSGTVDADLQTGVVGFPGNSSLTDTLRSIENIVTGRGSDTIHGSAVANVIRAGGGDDTASGRGGDDQILGQDGSDNLFGGDGNDQLFGGPNDIAVETLFGEDGNDLLAGEGGTDHLFGGTGDDLLRGGASGDNLDGEAGNDRLFGGLDGDIIEGDTGHDWLFGGDGADELHGGSGNDRLVGGLNGPFWDDLFGEDGNDWFIFRSVAESPPGFVPRDAIRGFDGAGQAVGDKIDLRGIDAIAGGGNDAFRFGVADLGGISVVEDGVGNSLVRGNTIAGGGAEFEVLIEDGAVAAADYRAADFFL